MNEVDPFLALYLIYLCMQSMFYAAYKGNLIIRVIKGGEIIKCIIPPSLPFLLSFSLVLVISCNLHSHLIATLTPQTLRRGDVTRRAANQRTSPSIKSCIHCA